MLGIHPECAEDFMQGAELEADYSKAPTMTSRVVDGHDIVRFEFVLREPPTLEYDLQGDVPEEELTEVLQRKDDTEHTYCIVCQKEMP